MMDCLHSGKNLQILGHKIVNFDREIRKPVEISILDNLWEQGVDFTKFSLSSRVYKQLFFNYYIKYILDFIKEQDKKCLFVVSKPFHSEFFADFDKIKYLKSYNTNIQTLFKLLPLINIIDTQKHFKDIINEHNPELIEIIDNEIITQSDSLSKRSYKGIKQKVKYYDLQYIDNKIFNELRYWNIF